jgi:hypothetical protein
LRNKDTNNFSLGNIIFTTGNNALTTKQTNIMAVALSLAVIAKNNSAYAATIGLPVQNIYHVRPASADEIANFSTALTAVVVKDVEYNQPKKTTYLSVTATATVITALNA